MQIAKSRMANPKPLPRQFVAYSLIISPGQAHRAVAVCRQAGWGAELPLLPAREEALEKQLPTVTSREGFCAKGLYSAFLVCVPAPSQCSGHDSPVPISATHAPLASSLF